MKNKGKGASTFWKELKKLRKASVRGAGEQFSNQLDSLRIKEKSPYARRASVTGNSSLGGKGESQGSRICTKSPRTGVRRRLKKTDDPNPAETCPRDSSMRNRLGEYRGPLLSKEKGGIPKIKGHRSYTKSREDEQGRKKDCQKI